MDRVPDLHERVRWDICTTGEVTKVTDYWFQVTMDDGSEWCFDNSEETKYFVSLTAEQLALPLED